MTVRRRFVQILCFALLGWAMMATLCNRLVLPGSEPAAPPAAPLLDNGDGPDFPDPPDDDNSDPDEPTILGGRLYRESSFPEVYIIHSGKKIWIPTPDALVAMGYDRSDVTVVPDGSLNSFPRFNIPSISATPGSLVYPPNHVSHFPLTGIPNTTRVVSQGKEIQLVELRGWLRGWECGDGWDFHYYLEVDSDWAKSQGIDLNRLWRVGNVAAFPSNAIKISPKFSPRKAVSLPLIKVELDAWGRGPARTQATIKPADWTFTSNCGQLFYPFNHTQPDPNRPPLEDTGLDLGWRGPYVRIAGSLVTDSPHDVPSRPNEWFSRHFAFSYEDAVEWGASTADWLPGVPTSNPEHYARWTEIHPPDLVEVLGQQEPRSTVRGVALAARVGWLPFGFSNSCEEAEFDLAPEASRPVDSRLAYEELRGPEIYFPWGENNDNGSWISVYDDHIHVKARVCGGAYGGSPGRFKAIYRAWWEPSGSGSGQPRSGSFMTSDGDRIEYQVEPNSVSADTVEFQLCLGAGLTWEKRMNLPDGLGASWDLIVRDSSRCDAESLWADQVLNGQSLTFSKAKGLGFMTPVHSLPLSSLGQLPGGTRVTFTWIKDN